MSSKNKWDFKKVVVPLKKVDRVKVYGVLVLERLLLKGGSIKEGSQFERKVFCAVGIQRTDGFFDFLISWKNFRYYSKLDEFYKKKLGRLGEWLVSQLRCGEYYYVPGLSEFKESLFEVLTRYCDYNVIPITHKNGIVGFRLRKGVIYKSKLIYKCLEELGWLNKSYDGGNTEILHKRMVEYIKVGIKYKDIKIPKEFIEVVDDWEKGLEQLTIKNKSEIILMDMGVMFCHNKEDIIDMEGLKKFYPFPYKFLTAGRFSYRGKKPQPRYYLWKGKKYSKEEYNSVPIIIDILSEYRKSLESQCNTLYLVVKKYVDKFFKEEGVDFCKCYTLGGLALSIFRTNYLKVVIEKLTLEEDNLIREAYYGGGVEVFRPYNKGKIYYYDVVSLYPYIMRNTEFSYGRLVPVFIVEEEDWLNDPYLDWVEVCIRVPSNFYFPPLPLKRNYLVFCTGDLVGLWHKEEIKLALSVGCKVLKVYGGYTCRSTSGEQYKLFELFVDKYFKEKSMGEGISVSMAKIILNGLYGMTSRRSIESRDFIIDRGLYDSLVKFENRYDSFIVESIGYLDENQSLLDQSDMMKVRGLIDDEKRKYTPMNVGIGATITALARVFMWKIIDKYKEYVLYSDTDSLFLTCPLEMDLIGKEMGKWNLKGVYDEGVFLGPKFYALRKLDGEKELISVPGCDKSQIQFEDCKRVFMGDTVKFNIFREIEVDGMGVYKNYSFSMYLKENIKRKKIIENGVWVDTEPYSIEELSNSIEKDNLDLFDKF